MNSPYRQLGTLPSDKKETKKECLLFHNWEVALKEGALDDIIRDSKLTKDKTVYYIDIFNDYHLVCSNCKKAKHMTTNPYYWQMAIENSKKLIQLHTKKDEERY